MRLLKNGIKRMKTLVTYTSNQGLSSDDGVVELCDYLTKNPTMRVIANVRKDNNDRIAYEFSAVINGPLVIITNSIGDAFYKSGNTYMVTRMETLQVDTSSGKEVVLWENASPSSAFVPQSININASKYRKFIVECEYANYYPNYIKSNVCTNKYLNNMVNLIGLEFITERDFRIENDNMIFNTGFVTRFDTIGSLSSDNGVAIPIKIVGVY